MHENWPTLSQSYVVGRRFFIVFFISIGGVFCCHGIDSFSIFILLLTGITDCSMFYRVATPAPGVVGGPWGYRTYRVVPVCGAPGDPLSTQRAEVR